MKAKRLIMGAALSACCLLMIRRAPAQPPEEPVIRLAELEIDPAQLDAYKKALKEEIAASVGLEPGVLRLYALSVKGHPNQIRMFEMYRDQPSYLAHLETPHFKEYKAATQHMVRALNLVETEPILLGSR